METKDYILLGIVLAGIVGFILYKNLSKPVDQLKIEPTDPNSILAIKETSQSTKSNMNYVTPTPQPSQVASAKTWSAAPQMQLVNGKNYKAVMHTSKGDIKIDLNEKEAPITVNNFVFLSNQGFYNGTKFHRIIKDFMIQGGDPKGNGTGGPGYRFADEPITGSYTAGTIAMANAGPNTNGSQFFIMHKDYELPKNYVIFGKASDADSLKIIDAIANTPTSANPNMPGENSVPAETITINSVEIIAE